jgi:hypothetical protein
MIKLAKLWKTACLFQSSTCVAEERNRNTSNMYNRIISKICFTFILKDMNKSLRVESLTEVIQFKSSRKTLDSTILAVKSYPVKNYVRKYVSKNGFQLIHYSTSKMYHTMYFEMRTFQTKCINDTNTFVNLRPLSQKDRKMRILSFIFWYIYDLTCTSTFHVLNFLLGFV